jgi:hypothetical protein
MKFCRQSPTTKFHFNPFIQLQFRPSTGNTFCGLLKLCALYLTIHGVTMYNMFRSYTTIIRHVYTITYELK